MLLIYLLFIWLNYLPSILQYTIQQLPYFLHCHVEHCLSISIFMICNIYHIYICTIYYKIEIVILIFIYHQSLHSNENIISIRKYLNFDLYTIHICFLMTLQICFMDFFYNFDFLFNILRCQCIKYIRNFVQQP